MRKYDRRVNNGATRERRRANSNLGRKPKWMKHLSRNSAHDILQEFDAIASPAEIYRYCWEQKLMPLLIGMREYVWNRLEGRPFVAENPNAVKKPNLLVQDNRLQIAINKLLPPSAAPGAQKLPRTRRKALPAAPRSRSAQMPKQSPQSNQKAISKPIHRRSSKHVSHVVAGAVTDNTLWQGLTRTTM